MNVLKTCIKKLICRRKYKLFCRHFAEDSKHKIIRLYEAPYPELVDLIKKYRRELRSEEFISTYRHRFLNHSIGAIKQTITDMEIKRTKIDEMADLSLIPTNVSIEILSNGTTHISPCFAIKTQQKAYLFNCPESASRFLSVLRLKATNIWDFFITRGIWENMGGLAGVLLGKEISQIQTRIHGPQRIKQYLECIRPFMDADFGKTSYPTAVEELSYENEFYEDPALKVQYIPLFGISTSSQQLVDVAYLIELKKPARAIDMLKIIALNIPKGPLIGQLKAGKTVVLPTGETINPEQVYAEQTNQNDKSSLLVVEIETDEKLESIYNNSIMQDYMNDNKQMHYIVHFTANSLFQTEKYTKWMEHFGKQCQHIVLNGTGEALPQMENIYLHQNILNRIDSDLFPRLYPKDFYGIIRQDNNIEINLNSRLNIIRPHVLQRFSMRGSFSGEDPILLGVEDIDIEEKYQNQPNAIEELKKYHKLTRPFYEEKLLEERDLYPSIVFLGTSSATPNRYRNVSAYMVQLNEKSNVIIDVGEGTYSQIRILFGPEKCDAELIKLHAIFITHSHQDHMNGMFLLIMKRIEAFKKLNVEYRPLIVVCNRNVRKPIFVYSRYFFDMSKYISVIDISFFASTASPNSAENVPAGPYVSSIRPALQPADPQLIPMKVPNKTDHMRRVVIDISMHLPTELYSPENWNLRSVKAVQVHHTAMSNGFIFEDFKKGRKLVFSGDTMPCDLLVEHGKGADVLVHEATFGDGMENDAFRKRHSTIGQAVEVGRRMAAKHVILTHFSSRYSRICPLPDYLFEEEQKKEQKNGHKNVGVAMDNMLVHFDRLSHLPKILPVYREIYAEALFEFSVKNIQRNLRFKK